MKRRHILACSLYTAIAAILLVALAACGGSTATTAAVTSSTVAATTAPETPTTAPTAPATPTAAPSPTTTALPAATAAATAESDLPALAPETAPPTPDGTAGAPRAASEPIRLVIPAIGLDVKPVAVGVDAQRVPIVPKHEAGWFTGSAMPGEGSNVVFWGHVLRWIDSPQIAAPFGRIHELRPGAEVKLVTADGKEWHYRVTQQAQVKPDDISYLYPTLGEHVTLVSCIGDKVIQNGTLTKTLRLVTVAEPVR